MWSIVQGIYTTVKAGAIPLATLFFIIALYKTVVSSPPEQALKKFLSDGIRYGLILFVIDKLDEIIVAIMKYADAFVKSVHVGTFSSLRNSQSTAILITRIESIDLDLSTVNAMDFGGTIETFFEQIGPFILFFIAGVITILVLASSGITVIGIAYQRIIKPLAMIPLSTVILSMSCCSDEGTKTMWSMGKTFLGLCLSGGLFIIAIHMGYSIGDKLAEIAPALSEGRDWESAIIIVVRANIGAVITTGLLKSMDAMIQKAFG